MNRTSSRSGSDPATRRKSGAATAPTPSPRSDASSSRPTGRSIFPTLSEIVDPRGPFLIPLAILLVARAAFWLLVPFAAEDAYITFRFARNLATGHGLAYNPGQHVMGFSSPLWTVWNALGFALTRDPLLWSRLWSLIADVVTVLVLGHRMRRSFGNPAAWCFTYFFAAWPYFSAVAMSGMEMSAMIALMVVAAALADARSPWTGPALAALALSRPEGLVAAALIGLGASWRDRGITAALVALGFLGLFLTFHTLVPQSVVAKAMIYGTPGLLGGRAWYAWLSPVLPGNLQQPGDVNHLVVLTLALGPSMVMGAIELWKQRAWSFAMAIGPALVVWLGYSFLGVTYFWWYLALPLMGISALAAVGFPRMVRGRALPIMCASIVIGMWTIAPRLYVTRGNQETFSFGRVADQLVRNARAGDKVVLEPIGIVGWRAPQVTVIDEVGLVSPQVAERRVKGGPGWYSDLVTAENPEWLVMRAGMIRSGAAFAGTGSPFRSAAERDALLARYQPIDTGLNPQTDEALVVLRRRS